MQDAKVWFVDLVSKRRNIEPPSVPGLTDGRIYSGRQAVELKLADEIGDEKAAMSWLSQGAQGSAGPQDRRLEADGGKLRPVRLAVSVFGCHRSAFRPRELLASPAKSRLPSSLTVLFPFGTLRRTSGGRTARAFEAPGQVGLS